jgi:hypothetical protein
MIAESGLFTDVGVFASVESEMFGEMQKVLRPADKDFCEKYRMDPAGFIVDCIKWELLAPDVPTPYQLEIAMALIEYGRVSARAPHTAGKTALMAQLILWFGLTRDGDDWKIPTTASAWRQLDKFLWPEIHKWARYLDWHKIGRPPLSRRDELFALKMELKTGEAFALAASDETKIEGAHADHMFYVFDEAKTIPPAIWDAAEGALSGKLSGRKEVFALSCSTPGEPSGRFYDIQTKKRGYEDWHVRHVTREEAISSNRMDRAWADQRCKQWGENSAVYQNRVLGEFASDAEDGIVPLSWVEAAEERWHLWQESGGVGTITSIGCDPSGGREGGNAATLTICKDFVKIEQLREIPIGDPSTSEMEIAGHIRSKWRINKGSCVYVDPIGIGSGILARLIEMGVNARGFHSSKATELVDESRVVGFLNWRAAGWWLLREMLNPKSKFDVCLPPDADGRLIGDLTAPHHRMSSRGLHQVEAKESIKKRLGRSTDYGDAVIYALLGQLLCDEEDAQKGPGRIWYRPQRIGEPYRL